MRPLVLVGPASLGLAKDPALSHLVCSQIAYLPLDLENLRSPLGVSLKLADFKALLFTSKHAPLSLQHGLEDTKALEFLKSLPSFVLADKSAQVAKSLGFKVAFVGQSGQAKGFVKEVKGILPSPTLFVRAQSVATDALDFLPSLIAYENTPIKLPPEQKPKSRSVLIFGAPSSYRHFLANFAWDPSYAAIALGKSTLNAFAPGVCAFLSPQPSLEACIELAKTL
ncbi:uroporphyrinogen-III synthase [Helicobacter ailurogastricus]|uniref:uroporphyrinogen-III synthase n=1 Tax=Helicobacter ailurogastricus TaxID=1578720 RepID=UPI0022C1DD9C|nr:uroporphyrinogen-III synthase [Helicobacter ailurogastricus]GLH57589.1 Uroporphyrinogen-III synthase HemD [Helicobacter ailurogastricus]GLH59783.1 Uroporphyrinogen-III synthase HemD [Helicobacter ailurogastricus]